VTIDASFGKLNYLVIHRAAATRTVALGHLRSTKPAEHYAALYAFTLTARKQDGGTLASFLTSGNRTDRILAAAALTRLHDRRGVRPLIDSLSSSREVSFWSPPLAAWSFARVVLLEATGLDLGLRRATSAREANAASIAWRRWWGRKGASFQFPLSEVPLP
jgi:hypothetical protein